MVFIYIYIFFLLVLVYFFLSQYDLYKKFSDGRFGGLGGNI